MKYDHILAAFYSTPLALLPEKIEAVRRFLLAKAAGGEIDPAEIEAAVSQRRRAVYVSREALENSPVDLTRAAMPSGGDVVQARLNAARPDGVQLVGRVAVVQVFGAISQRVGMLERASGGVSTEELGATLDTLARDKAVKCVVMAFDSPGGSVFGVGELAAKMRAVRDEKKLVGLADSVAASAAYWLLAQCGEINVTPGGQVGSIGVFCAHEDLSGQQEQEGVRTTLVSAGEHKVEGNPYAPLSDAARAELQAKVDHYYGLFVADVAKGRGVSEAKVRSDFGGGRMVTAQAAVGRGMADRVATVDQVLRRLGAYDGGGSAAEAPGVPLAARLAAARARAVEVE